MRTVVFGFAFIRRSVALGCVLAFGVAAFGVAAPNALALTQAEEIELGQRVARDALEKQGPQLPATAPQARRVTRIGARLARLSSRRGIPFSYAVLDDRETINAFAAPGGPIFVTRAMLDFARNDAELAAVLGHETAHIEHRHMALRIEKQERAQNRVVNAGEKVLGRRSASQHERFLRGASAVAFNVWARGYNREAESQADATGTRWMSRLGYDPRAAIAILRRMRDGKRTGALERVFSSHPPTEAREADLQALITREHLLQIAQENSGPRLNENSALSDAEPPIKGALPAPVPTAVPEDSATVAAPTLTPVAPPEPAPTAIAKPVVIETAVPTTAAQSEVTAAPVIIAPVATTKPVAATTPISSAAIVVSPPDAVVVDNGKAVAPAPSAWGWIVLTVGVLAMVGVIVAWQQGVFAARATVVPVTPLRVAPVLWIEIQAPDGPMRRVPLEMNERIVVGREGVDLMLFDSEVSAVHAEVRRTEAGVWLIDLDSTNGTYLNQTRIGSTVWDIGQTARVGATALTLHQQT